MPDKEKVSKVVIPEKIEEVKEDNYYVQPPSDSEEDICGPLHCDKEL